MTLNQDKVLEPAYQPADWPGAASLAPAVEGSDIRVATLKKAGGNIQLKAVVRTLLQSKMCTAHCSCSAMCADSMLSL